MTQQEIKIELGKLKIEKDDFIVISGVEDLDFLDSFFKSTHDLGYDNPVICLSKGIFIQTIPRDKLQEILENTQK